MIEKVSSVNPSNNPVPAFPIVDCSHSEVSNPNVPPVNKNRLVFLKIYPHAIETKSSVNREILMVRPNGSKACRKTNLNPDKNNIKTNKKLLNPKAL